MPNLDHFQLNEDVTELAENERTYECGKVINKSNDKEKHQGPMNHIKLQKYLC